jgi:hypothetical protein
MTNHTVSPEDDRLLTQDELAARWQVTVRHLQILRKAKKGPKHIVMGSVRYPLSEVVKYEQSQLKEGIVHENRFPEGASMEGVRARKNKPKP